MFVCDRNLKLLDKSKGYDFKYQRNLAYTSIDTDKMRPLLQSPHGIEHKRAITVDKRK